MMIRTSMSRTTRKGILHKPDRYQVTAMVCEDSRLLCGEGLLLRRPFYPQ